MSLQNLKIGVRLQILVAGAIVGMVAIGTLGLTELKTTLIEDRKAKTQDVVRAAHAILEHFAGVEANGMPASLAQGQAIAAIRSIRYGDGDYFWINDLEPKMVMHPIKPELNGKDLSEVKDPTGKRIFVEFVQAVKNEEGGGFVNYMWPKPGFEKPVEKLSYVSKFEPWGWIIGTGVYLDDVDAIFREELIIMGGAGLAILLAVMAGSTVIGRSITRPLSSTAENMERLADNDTDIEISYTEARSEIGALARTMEVFRERAIEMEQMRARQITASRRNQRKVQSELLALTTALDEEVNGAIGTVVEEARGMQSLADEMEAAVTLVNGKSSEAAGAAEAATESVNAVAAAAEEMTASVEEISRQVAKSTEIANSAVGEAKRANDMVQGLATAAGKIGEVVDMITDIAEQTNLLALNATIEAARAGDAGKGFAVVANEVKNLANQTAKATDEISSQINEVQSATDTAVDAIRAIGTTIEQINEITTAVASAVEEQSAATQEISRAAAQAAQGTQQASGNIGFVSGEIAETGQRSSAVKGSAGTVRERVQSMSEAVTEIISSSRDRRLSERHTVNVAASFQVNGNEPRQCLLQDIALGGAAVLDRNVNAEKGSDIKISVAGLGDITGSVVAHTDHSTFLRLDIEDESMTKLETFVQSRRPAAA